jgi:hypothetical protein
MNTTHWFLCAGLLPVGCTGFVYLMRYTFVSSPQARNIPSLVMTSMEARFLKLVSNKAFCGILFNPVVSEICNIEFPNINSISCSRSFPPFFLGCRSGLCLLASLCLCVFGFCLNFGTLNVAFYCEI